MRRIKVTLDAGGREAEVHPMYDVLANGEFVDYATAMQWSYTESEVAMLHYVEGDIDAFRAATESVSKLVNFDLVRAGEDACYTFVNCETTPAMRQLYGPLQEMTAIPVPPVIYHADGTLSFSLVGPAAELQSAVELVPDPVSVTVDEITDIGSVRGLADARLSPRQREALEAALELGYYDIPREGDHAAVAAAMDCAPSTAAEHLRKAEATVIESVVGGTPSPLASQRS
jgi:predicted DNA binding protein